MPLDPARAERTLGRVKAVHLERNKYLHESHDPQESLRKHRPVALLPGGWAR